MLAFRKASSPIRVSPLLVIVLSWLLFSLPTYVYGQATLRGAVTDSATNEPLIGANIYLKGTALGGVTDREGKFMIVGVPAGKYTLRISYVGYKAKELQIDVSENAAMSIDLRLTPAAIEAEEVLVTAQARGQIAAINQQITSNTIVNVVSEEKIQELPDANAAEAIGRLPGVSIIRSGGEATGVVLRGLSSKFSNITIDGVRIPATDSTTRDVDLSMISQGSLAGIELYKTLTPDQDGDAIAGTVNLVTRKAPSERLLRFDLKGVHNQLMKSTKLRNPTGSQYDFSGRYAERFFNDVVGVQIQANIENKIRSREDITYTYWTSKNPDLPYYDPSTTGLDNDYNISEFIVDFTDETRKRGGGQVILDLDTPDSGSVKLTGLYSGTQRNSMLYDRLYPAHTGTWDYTFRYTELGTYTASAALQGKNFLSGFEVDWNASYAHSKVNNPFDYQMIFTETPGAIPGLPSAVKDHPELNVIPYAANNYVAAACSSATYFKTENFDRERTASLGISKKYLLSNLFSGELKFGGKYKDRSRWMSHAKLDDNAYLHNFYTTGVDSARMVQSRFADYYLTHNSTTPFLLPLSYFINQPAPTRDLLGLYRMSPLIDVDALKLWYDLDKGASDGASLEYNSNAQAALDDYAVTERLSAGYLMNTLNIGQAATLIAGVRVEKETNDYEARFSPGGLQTIGLVVSAPSGIRDTTATYTETIWLPNVQLTLRPTDFLSVRFAAYKALARPDYNLRLPQFVLGTFTPVQLKLGNPNLRDTKAWNYEVNTQVYSNTVGLISVSAFYKKIDDLYHEMSAVNISRNFDSLLTALGVTWQNAEPFRSLIAKNSNYTLSVPYNSDHPSYAWGFEFSHQINFGFLPGYLRNITLSYNVSITRSETYIIQSESRQDSVWQVNPRTGEGKWVPGTPYNIPVDAKRESENQPELYGNVALGYDIGGFSGRLSVFHQGEYVQQYSTNGTNDIHVDSFTKWDLALKQEISKNISLFLNVNNLTNKQETTSRINTVTSWHLIRTADLYGTTADLGVRITL
jgi:TonB-dependent receptor